MKHKRSNPLGKLKTYVVIVPLLSFVACTENAPSIDNKIVESTRQMNDAVKVQMQEMIRLESDTTNSLKLKLNNTKSIAKFMNEDYQPLFTNKKEFTETSEQLKSFIDSNCKFYGLFPKAYHQENIEQLMLKLSSNDTSSKNAENWAKAELYMTDAWFQIVKHIKNGRLYKDTNNVYLDTALTIQTLIPSIEALKNNPNQIDSVLAFYEPKFKDYDSLKIYLKEILQTQTSQKQYTKLTYPTKDSLQFVKQFVDRLNEEGFNIDTKEKIDSQRLVSIITEYQQKHNQKTSGNFSVEMIDNMNMNATNQFSKIALSLDKLRQLKIPNKGTYVLVNIPSFMLRAYDKNGAALESKVVVGKVSTKTPIMESEISKIIVMPRWYVPPSILKIPGYIERKRRNPNYIVRGKSVIQKSGPGNALGKVKFHFKSGDAIYLHDTNEKWAFGSSKRAASHGCVRVQSFTDLASFLNKATPLVERNYMKVKDQIKVDSLKGDTSFTYKYVVKDSIRFTEEVVSDMLQHSAHHELELETKIPVYISYMTCAVRNGMLINYKDVYGYDEVLEQKYLAPYM